MNKPQLTVDRLLLADFEEVGCWELNSARDLAHQIVLPQEAGVYAFAIDNVVQYVGLASKSLRKRLGFYRKPAASQRTNVRLNEIIRGHLGRGTIVQILIAHPPDHEWNGFTIKGAEGLEAGLIYGFDLPWNMRGSERSHVPVSGEGAVLVGRLTDRAQKIVDLVKSHPGMTELEIAKAMYGPAAVQPQVNTLCRQMVREGRIERRGEGRSDPHTYYPVEQLDPRSSPGCRSGVKRRGH